MKSKVVHHLPGRLRLYVPALEKLSLDWNRYTSDLVSIIKLKEGINKVEVGIVTGRVLIRYDPESSDLGKIQHWLKHLTLLLYEGYADEPFYSKSQIGPFLKKMRDRVRRELVPKYQQHFLAQAGVLAQSKSSIMPPA